MAVFTPVSELVARDLLQHYTIGDLTGLQGIGHGIENTNYFLDTSSGRFILTLFERLTLEQLPYYIELMRHLAERGVPVPAPQTRRDGTRLSMVLGKPAAIVSCLKGQWVPEPELEHCQQVGAALARMHLAGQDYPLEQPNLRGLAWWQDTVPKVLPFMPEEAAALLQDELKEQIRAQQHVFSALPRGPAHADLFRDNVLFEQTPQGPLLGGFIDFYFAGHDTFLFDLAVTVNDWCLASDNCALDLERVQAMTSAYAAVRSFTDAERDAWPLALRAGALRFWISRLFDLHLPRPAETLTPKDPSHFERLLRSRRASIPCSLH